MTLSLFPELDAPPAPVRAWPWPTRQELAEQVPTDDEARAALARLYGWTLPAMLRDIARDYRLNAEHAERYPKNFANVGGPAEYIEIQRAWATVLEHHAAQLDSGRERP